jgi:hypothetical protein
MNTLYKIPPEKKGDTESVTELVLLTRAQDWSFVRRWETQVHLDSGQSLKDSLEYAKLGAKRWSWLSSQNLCVGSMKELQERLQKNPKDELGIALALVRREKKGQPKVLGFCYARRLWINHLQLEFLASMEAGFGALLLYGLGFIAREIGAPQLWGECTESSQGFYRKVKAKLLAAHLNIELKKEGRASSFVQEMQLPGSVEDHFKFGKVELELMADILDEMGEP